MRSASATGAAAATTAKPPRWLASPLEINPGFDQLSNAIPRDAGDGGALLTYTRLLEQARFAQLDALTLRNLLIGSRGLPDVLRGKAWLLLSHAEVECGGELLEQAQLGWAPQDLRFEQADAAIDRDIQRTFPSHALFEAEGSLGQEQLSVVLRAYARADADVGYCQGMGFITAFLLIYLSPQHALGVLTALMQRYNLRALLAPGMPALQPALGELRDWTRILLPDVAARLDQLGVDPQIFFSQCLLTLFTYNFPLSFVARVMDLFLLQGWSVVFRVCVALLMTHRTELAGAADFESALVLLRGIPHSVHDQDAVMELALKINMPELTSLYMTSQV